MTARSSGFDGAVEVRAFEAKDEPSVLVVLQAAFGRWPCDVQDVEPSEFFRWKHVAGPFGRSTLLVAVADDAVVGFAAYMPWRFTAGEQTLTAMRGVDLAVHPAYRRAGISVAIRSAMDFSDDVAFTWSNPNDQSRPGSVRSGRNEVGRLPHFVQPSWRLRDTMKRALGAGSKTLRQLPIEAESAAEALRDDADASLLLARAGAQDDRLATIKDLDYLRWRYGRFKEYRAVSADPGVGGPGMAIFRARRHGPFWVLDICELFVAPNDRRTARRLFRQVKDAAPADLISCSFSTVRDAALRGFVRSSHGTVLMTYTLRQNVLPDPTQRESWALSLGDLELL